MPQSIRNRAAMSRQDAIVAGIAVWAPLALSSVSGAAPPLRSKSAAP